MTCPPAITTSYFGAAWRAAGADADGDDRRGQERRARQPVPSGAPRP